MTRKDRALATDLYGRIVGNVDDFHEGRIDYETFSERQRGLWTTLDAAGPEVKRAVLADIRERLPSPASRLTPRPTPLHRAALAAAAEGRWSSLDKSVQQAIRRLAEDGWIDLDEHIPNEARGIGLTAAGRLLLASWRVAEGAEQGQPDRPPHLRAAEFAALAWSTASGGLLRAVIREGAAGSIDLVVQRAPSPHAPAYPSLVDDHLVWLVLDTTRPGDRVLTQTFREGITITTAVDARRGERALERHADQFADATRRALAQPPHPDLRDMDAGRGAWEQAARSSAAHGCPRCRYRLGSNLDCPTCRNTIRRDPDAAWNTAKIAAALVALDFPEELAGQLADAARRALATVTTLDLLTRDFFDAWAVRFTEHTAKLFAVAADRHLARDLVEAQMLAPWFALPKREPARTLALPPEPSSDELVTQPRALLRDLLADRIPAEEARRRVRTHACIRRLVAAVAELYGPDARLAGDLLAPAIVIHRGGRPVLHHVTTLLGERTTAAPDLTSDDRYTIERRLADLRVRLVDAVATEHTCCFGEDDDGRAIDLALQHLRAEITSTSRATTDTTTIALTPEQRLWLLDLLAGFVEDDDASRDKTEEGPPPPQVEWARALAERLSAEIAALAEPPTEESTT